MCLPFAVNKNDTQGRARNIYFGSANRLVPFFLKDIKLQIRQVHDAFHLNIELQHHSHQIMPIC